jgi:hypothetical protein
MMEYKVDTIVIILLMSSSFIMQLYDATNEICPTNIRVVQPWIPRLFIHLK